MDKFILDFNNLSFEINKEFNNIADEFRLKFHELINDLSKDKSHKIDWWVTGLSSRNIHMSNLFIYCCQLKLIKKLADEGRIPDVIVVNSKALRAVIIKYFLINNIKTKIRYSEKHSGKSKNKLSFLKITLKKIFVFYLIQYLFNIILLTKKFIYAKISSRFRTPALPEFPITLIDTFILENSFNGTSFTDIYYPGLLDYLSVQEKKEIFYTFTFYNIKNYKTLYRKIRNSDQNFLVEEDFLKLIDYVKIFLYPFRIFKCKTKIFYLEDFNITKIINAELKESAFSGNSWISIMKYYFISRIKERGIRIRIAVDWFENQVIDKGLNSGLRKFYPDLVIKGYQGFIVGNYELNIFPTKMEEECNLLPTEILVTGSALIKNIKTHFRDLIVKTAPAFRSNWVWQDKRDFNKSSESFILIGLPFELDESNRILKLVASALEEKKIRNYKFYIKNHPITRREDIINNYDETWPEEFEFINGDFEELIKKSYLLISTNSSICLESIATGIPVIIVGNNSGLTFLNIPEDIEQDIWKLCYNSKDLISAIILYLNRSDKDIKRHEKIGRNIRKNYFEPVKKESVRNFLMLD